MLITQSLICFSSAVRCRTLKYMSTFSLPRLFVLKGKKVQATRSLSKKVLVFSTLSNRVLLLKMFALIPLPRQDPETREISIKKELPVVHKNTVFTISLPLFTKFPAQARAKYTNTS